MSFRTIVIKKRCKLEYSLNCLVYRGEDENLEINLSEITTLIIQSMQVSLTSALISKLIESKVKVMFCDGLNNPQCELIPYYGSYNVKEKIDAQMSISSESADTVWREIIIRKIRNQASNLLQVYKDSASKKLTEYSNDVQNGDATNREGHAAKVYFNALFGNDFSREKDIDINKYLNYGYSIILSSLNREIKNLGYMTEIGIHHIGATNPFNLSCDFMEPLRTLIDSMVIQNQVNEDNFKIEFINVLNRVVLIDGKKMILDNAIRLYVLSLFNALINGDTAIKFIDYERI